MTGNASVEVVLLPDTGEAAGPRLSCIFVAIWKKRRPALGMSLKASTQVDERLREFTGGN